MAAIPKLIYTQYSRHHNKKGLFAASNASSASPPTEDPIAIIPQEHEKDVFITSHPLTYSNTDTLSTAKTATDLDRPSIKSANSSTTSLASTAAPLPSSTARPIGIFPQYLASTTTNLEIRENSIPNLPDSFLVSTIIEGVDTPLFKVHRSYPSWHKKQVIIDAKTDVEIMTVQRNPYSFPQSFDFIDPSDKRVCDVQGNFFMPYTGGKSTASFINASTGEKIELVVKGSWKNQMGAIKDAQGNILCKMESNIFELRNLVGGRRTYNLTVREGMDLVIAVGLICAMDARERPSGVLV
jgi:hypothetical protein